MIERIKTKFAARTPEQEILFNRLVIGILAALACYWVGLNIAVSAAFTVYLLCNGALYVMQKADLWQAEKRWYAAIILDVWMVMATMLVEPENMSWAYPMILWMILGNGFRFGLRYLAAASILSALGFGFVVATSAYWQENSITGWGLTGALIIIPAYCSTLIRKLSKSKEQAEMASRAKSYFLASVSHELRTPLNAILGYGNHLKQMKLPKKQHEMVEASVLAGEHLLKLIEQLIQVAKTETGAPETKNTRFRPTDIMTEVRDIMAIRAEEKGLSVKLHAAAMTDELVDGPEEITRNILINLMGNAIKFTESGSISIRSAIHNADGTDMLCVTVCDTGIGIAQGAQEKIFKPFQQADDSVMDRFGGTGLGLAICRQLVEQVGGEINVTSQVGHGSEFHVKIPVNVGQNVNGSINDTAAADGFADRAEEDIHILSLGQLEPELLASAQSQDNYIVRHIACASVADIQSAIDGNELAKFSIALIDYNLAAQLDADHSLWAQFAAAEVAPVLVEAAETVELEDIALRAAFASVIPATPNFQQLRSAVRIGCSFAKHNSFDEEYDDSEPATVAPRSVLVADDNRTNRNVLSAILESAGHKVIMATDGDEALDILEQGGIDIWLLDVNMPRLNGIDACAMWRQIEGNREHLPIIGVTADATSETEEKCLAAGMDLRITKPVDARLLINIIEEYCGAIEPNETAPLSAPGSVASDPLGRVVSLQNRQVSPSSALNPAQIEYLASIGNMKFVAEMIDSFRQDAEEVITDMQKSVAGGDVDQFRFCAHALKSSANNIGAETLAAIAAKLEKITEGEFHEMASTYLQKVEAELLRVRDALDLECKGFSSDVGRTSSAH
ncbi:ATP-binding protein [Sphingorhabdus arenilitoris]|uniref:histidine kinase n=1 Tax=Sphingorhabdus arenilitoris TaxID=1490041 RepID=A0ABV8RFS1_9SPHN